jgi:signal transduction histidine kinase
VVLSTGVGLALLLMGVLVAAGAWNYFSHRKTLALGEERSLEKSAQALASASEALLAQGEASALRRLIGDIAIRDALEDATVTLSGGKVVADAQASDITLIELPATWGKAGSSTGEATVTSDGDGVLTATVPLSIPGRGDATLTLVRRVQIPMSAGLEGQVAMGAIGAVALCGGLLIYRGLRRRLRALGAIQESLKFASQFEEGELPASGLLLADHLGEDAKAWNRILDVSHVRRQRAELAAAAEHVRESGGGGDHAGAFDALWLGLVVLDEAGKVRAANGAAAVLLKRPKNDLADKSFASVVQHAQVLESLAPVLTGKSRQRTNVEVTQDGEAGEHAESAKAVLRFTIRPMRREDGAAAMVVIEDVTQQRVADESRNGFVAQATHELRTPLTSMRLYLEQLVDEGDKDPLVKARCLNVLGAEVRRLERIVGDMLSVSEIEAGTLKLRTDDVRLDALFEELREDFGAQAADKEIDLRIELPPKLPVIAADRDKVVMAVHNLVGNAMKYTPQGGVVKVRVTELNGALAIDVTDNGIGIKEEEQELIFDKFYRSKDKRITNITGTGIGLSLARQVVRLHGGDITVKSQIDKGSTFTITMPLAAPAAQRLAA